MSVFGAIVDSLYRKADKTVSARLSLFRYGGEENEYLVFWHKDGAVVTWAADGKINVQYPAYNISSDLHTKKSLFFISKNDCWNFKTKLAVEKEHLLHQKVAGVHCLWVIQVILQKMGL